MNGVIELTRRNSPGEHLQPLSPLDPPPKGGVTRNFRDTLPLRFQRVSWKKNRDTPRNCGKNGVLIFCEGGDPKFSGHTPTAVSEGVPTRKIGTRPELRENWCPDFFGGGGHGTPSARGRRDSLSSTDSRSEPRKQKFDMLAHATCSQHHGHARLCTVRFATNLSWWLLSKLWEVCGKRLQRWSVGDTWDGFSCGVGLHVWIALQPEVLSQMRNGLAKCVATKVWLSWHYATLGYSHCPASATL